MKARETATYELVRVDDDQRVTLLRFEALRADEADVVRCTRDEVAFYASFAEGSDRL